MLALLVFIAVQTASPPTAPAVSATQSYPERRTAASDSRQDPLWLTDGSQTSPARSSAAPAAHHLGEVMHATPDSAATAHSQGDPGLAATAEATWAVHGDTSSSWLPRALATIDRQATQAQSASNQPTTDAARGALQDAMSGQPTTPPTSGRGRGRRGGASGTGGDQPIKF